MTQDRSKRTRGGVLCRLLAVTAMAILLPGGGRLTAAEAGKSEKPKNPHGAYVEECSLCHAADSWSPARISPQFNHAKFGFALEAAHAVAACRTCHTNLDFTKEKVRTECVHCHLDVHQGELGTDCGRCHSTRSFVDETRMRRAHHLTRFPLIGAHRVADCTACHPPAAQGQPSYVNTSTECETCHLDEYQATTDPDHETSGFPTDCRQCHAAISWRPARPGSFLQHDALFFPIYSGAHRGKWSTCSVCHTNQNNYSEFDCLQCHAHRKTEMDGKHASVSGYSYDSVACYSCHPDGRKP